MSAPVCVDLFCGCGGLSTGLLDAGIDVRIGVDHDAPSVETFNVNHEPRGTTGIKADVRELAGADLRDQAGGCVDLLGRRPDLSTVQRRREAARA